MFKSKISTLILVTLFSCLSFYSHGKVETFFTPEKEHANKVFNKMFTMIAKARQQVHVSIYSWSLNELNQSLLKAAKNGADVKIVIHPSI